MNKYIDISLAAMSAMNDQTKTKCVVCASELPEGARYCKECGHYQSRLRDFVSKTGVSEIIALLSTSAIVFKFLNLTLLTPPLAISAYASQCTPTKFVLLFSNQGKRPGVVQQVEATRYYKRGGARLGEDQVSIPLKSEAPPVIAGGSAKFAPLTFVPAADREFPAERTEASLQTCYEVAYKISEFGKPPNPGSGVLASCDCL